MRVATLPWRPRPAFAAVVAITMLVVVGCVTNEAEPPPLNGPSQTGLSAQLFALPDTVNADGLTRSTVRLVLVDQNGNPASGRAVLFKLLAGDGKLVPSSASTYVGPVQGEYTFVMATSDAGEADVVYVAGRARDTIVTIGIRPYNFDATMNTYLATVEITQR